MNDELENIGKEVILPDRGVVPSFACRNWQKKHERLESG